MARAIRPLTGHSYDPIGGVTQLADVLLSGQHDLVPAFGITGFIDNQHALGMSRQLRPGLPQAQAAPVESRWVLRRVVQEMMQPLAPGAGDNCSQSGKGLVVLARQEQADQILAKGVSGGSSRA